MSAPTRTFHAGIPEPYNTLPDGQSFYVWQEDAKSRIMDLVGCSTEDAAMVLAEVRMCAGRGYAHEPIRTQALKEAARAHSVCPSDDPLAKMRYALSAYGGTLCIAGQLERGEIEQADAADRLMRQRVEQAD